MKVDVKVDSQGQIMAHFSCKIGTLLGPESLSCPELSKSDGSSQPYCDESIEVSNDVEKTNLADDRKIPFMKNGQTCALYANFIFLSPIFLLSVQN